MFDVETPEEERRGVTTNKHIRGGNPLGAQLAKG